MSLCLKQYNVTPLDSIEAQVPTMVCEALCDLLTTTGPYFLPNSCIAHSASHKLCWFEQAWDTSLSGLYTLHTLSLECFSPVLSEFLLRFLAQLPASQWDLCSRSPSLLSLYTPPLTLLCFFNSTYHDLLHYNSTYWRCLLFIISLQQSSMGLSTSVLLTNVFSEPGK